ncbi:MAG: UDP-N-acetylglucosamine 2-epimerase [Bacteroidetes bacterium RIFCSPLOWO2_12_FULL_35_15]|nr:MAG: UDP-N-acetylglucosamine 2-epimerase [Bacteroidetes bacterium RIFCSPLOWO2_12_FULL_35_15]
MKHFKILTIIGARPQIIKAAALSRAIKRKFADRIKEVIVHTGQHYDENMSQVFFDELAIPHPNYNLNVGSGSHGKQTATMIEGIEEILLKEKPNAIVLYGDTNSTLAGAIAASKISIPVVHIEAGLRSFNKSMPEEINRILCDHVSTLLFTPTKAGFNNLLKEGFKENNQAPFSIDNPKIYHCGDVMYDNSLYFSAIAEEKTSILKTHNLQKGEFVLATIHRNNNTDEPIRLTTLFNAINKIATENKIRFIIPLHPRTAKLLPKNLSSQLYTAIKTSKYINIIEPVSFLEMIALEKNAKLIMTDSGGVQKEAFFFQKPCIILRSETEWVELVNCGSAKIADADETKIVDAYNYFSKTTALQFPGLFGEGTAAEFICEKILKYIV